YLNRPTLSFEEIAGKGAKQLTFNQIPLEQAALYAAEDADITLQLHQAIWPQLEAIPSLTKVFHDIEMPLVPVLARMELNGCHIDVNMLRHQSQELASKMAELESQAYELAGEEFNLSSPKQLGEILFAKQGLRSEERRVGKECRYKLTSGRRMQR